MDDKKRTRMKKEEWLKQNPKYTEQQQAYAKRMKHSSVAIDQLKQLEQYVIDIMFTNLTNLEDNIIAVKYGIDKNKARSILNSISRNVALRGAIKEAVLQGMRHNRVVVTNRVGSKKDKKPIRHNVLQNNYQKITERERKKIAYQNSINEKNYSTRQGVPMRPDRHPPKKTNGENKNERPIKKDKK